MNLNTIAETKRHSPHISLMEICVMYNLPYMKTYKAIKQSEYAHLFTGSNNGKSRTSRKAQAQRAKLVASDKTEIERLYHEEQKTLREIGDYYGTTAATVLKFCREHDIPRRSKSEITARRMKCPEARAKLRQISIDNYLTRRKYYNTAPELHFKRWVQSQNISYIRQYRINSRSHPYDFFLPDFNLLVEIDGTYWHSKPEQKIKDEKHTAEAIGAGYNIVRIDTDDLIDRGHDYLYFLGKALNETRSLTSIK